MAETPSFPTVGEIARRLGVPLHRVEYAIRACGIEPAGWAGNARVFSPEAIDEVARWFDALEMAKAGPRALRRP